MSKSNKEIQVKGIFYYIGQFFSNFKIVAKNRNKGIRSELSTVRIASTYYPLEWSNESLTLTEKYNLLASEILQERLKTAGL